MQAFHTTTDGSIPPKAEQKVSTDEALSNSHDLLSSEQLVEGGASGTRGRRSPSLLLDKNHVLNANFVTPADTC